MALLLLRKDLAGRSAVGPKNSPFLRQFVRNRKTDHPPNAIQIRKKCFMPDEIAHDNLAIDRVLVEAPVVPALDYPVEEFCEIAFSLLSFAKLVVGERNCFFVGVSF